jgi:hypothetical protein
MIRSNLDLTSQQAAAPPVPPLVVRIFRVPDAVQQKA